MYIFGDGVSTTTNYAPSQYYYGYRNSNGRVWVEVLAQRQGLGANSITNSNWSNSPNNWSYYGDYSLNLITNINNFPTPSDSPTALYVVWVNDADFVNDIATFETSENQAQWSAAINQSLSNHWSIINSLYAKGARTIVMPNAVDLTEIPEFDGIMINNPGDRAFIRQQIFNFNSQFAALLNQAVQTLPGLTIYEPDFFGLLDNALTNSAAYGLTNALYDGVPIDALDDLQNPAINGPGTNFVFWDPTDPSAKFHEIMADTVQQMISPVKLGHLAVLSPNSDAVITNQLTLLNVPVGLNGYVDGCTNSGQAQAYWTWTAATNFTSVSTNQSVFVYAAPLPPVQLPSGNGSIYPGAPQNNSSVGAGPTNTVPSGIEQYYRVRFPLSWNWP